MGERNRGGSPSGTSTDARGELHLDTLELYEASLLPTFRRLLLPDLAAGERMFSRHDFRPVLEAGGLGIVQPDLSHAGGITECLKIAAMADTYNVGFAPHCPLGPIALAEIPNAAENPLISGQRVPAASRIGLRNCPVKLSSVLATTSGPASMIDGLAMWKMSIGISRKCSAPLMRTHC